MRESRTLEYKENLSSNTFLKTISAYANYGEGKIIFGINDQRHHRHNRSRERMLESGE